MELKPRTPAEATSLLLLDSISADSDTIVSTFAASGMSSVRSLGTIDKLF